MDRFILRVQMRAVLPEGVVLHASSVAADDRAFVFLAPSGGGKSTVMNKLCGKTFGALADDSVIVAKGTDAVIRCLPCGSMKQNVGTENIHAAALRAFCFVEKGPNSVKFRINGRYAFYRAMRHSSIMAYNDITPEEQRQAAGFLARLFISFPVYIFRYGINDAPEELLNAQNTI